MSMIYQSLTPTRGEETEALTGEGDGGGGDTVVATSTKGGQHKTVYAMFQSSSTEEEEEGFVFLRRVWALLVLQYGFILFTASLFVLLRSFRQSIKPYHSALDIVALAGIVASLSLALTKGPIWPWAHVSLVLLTLFTGLKLGVLFADADWGEKGLIALGQATSSFAIILALLQFPGDWISYGAVSLVCLGLSGLWILILVITGSSWAVAAAICLGGWAFVLLQLYCCKYITKHVAPEEYILATLFILFPEGLLCIQSKERHPHGSDQEGEGLETKAEYGGVSA